MISPIFFLRLYVFLVIFQQYGEISDYVSDDSTPSVVLNFKTRKEAEVAMLKGKHFQVRIHF